VFYLIPPNSKNLALYEEWMLSQDKQETFLADLADVCFKLVPAVFILVICTVTQPHRACWFMLSFVCYCMFIWSVAVQVKW